MKPVWLRAAIVVLATTTALIHWSLLLGFFDVPFLLSGLGYFALLGALFAPHPALAARRKLIHYVFMGYTAVIILAWVAMGARNPVGYADKLVEVLLILALWLHLRATQPSADPDEPPPQFAGR